MTASRAITWAVGIWLVVLAFYAGVSLSLSRGSQSLVVFGDVVQCIVPLIANAGLLQRRYAVLAAQHLLDADRAELHTVDDGAVSMDLLRGISSSAPPPAVSRRHSVLPARHPLDGRAGPPAASQERCGAPAPGVYGLWLVVDMVDLCLHLF